MFNADLFKRIEEQFSHRCLEVGRVLFLQKQTVFSFHAKKRVPIVCRHERMPAHNAKNKNNGKKNNQRNKKHQHHN